MPDKWWETGAIGTKAWADETNFMKFLGSYYGSYLTAQAHRLVYAFQLDASPTYRWWRDNGKPTNAIGYKQAIQEGVEKPPPEPVEDEYGVSILGDVATLPDGTPTTAAAWNALSPDQKLQTTGIRVQGDYITFADGSQKMASSLDLGEATTALEIRDRLSAPDIGMKFPTIEGGTVVPAKGDETKIGGYTEQEWALGIPQFEWEKEQASRLSPWQEAQIAEQAEQRRSEESRFGLDRARNEAQLWRQRVGAGGTKEEVIPPEELSRQFESARSQALGVYSQQPDVNWVQIGQEKLKQNPWANQTNDITLQDELKSAQDAYKIAQNQVKTLEELIKAPYSTQNQFGGEFASSLEDAWNRQQHWGKRVDEIETKIIDPDFIKQSADERAFAEKYGAAPPPAVPTGVSTPAWLQSRAYGGATSKPIGSQVPGTGTLGGKAPPLATPSAQQWRGMTLGDQRQWGGYAKFAGQDPEQLLRQTEQMLPQKLSLGRAWSSARQF